MSETGPQRECGGCTLCCKVLRVDWLDKPANRWCKHSVPAGCGIHGSHPDLCQAYFCAWIDSPDLGDEWRPDRSKIVMSRSASGKGLFVNVDVDRPDAWKRAPFYQAFKQWSVGARTGDYIVISVGPRVYCIFPEEDLEICDLGPGSRIEVGYREGPSSRQPHVRVQQGDGSMHEFFGQLYS